MNKTLKTTNLFVLIMLTIIDAIMVGGYLQDAGAGNITTTTAVVVCAILGVTWVVSLVAYLTKKDGKTYKYISSIGYVIVYGTVLYFAKSDLVYVIVFPIFVVYVLYFDTAFMAVFTGIFTLLNIVQVILMYVDGHTPSGGSLEISNVLLQVCSVAISLTALTIVTKIENRLNKEELDTIENERNKTDDILKAVLNLGENVKANSAKASSTVQELNEATTATLETMKNIADSNSDNAKNIENQTVMTNNIQTMIIKTSKEAEQMAEIAKDSLKLVTKGNDDVVVLKDKSTEITNSNNEVIKAINNFVNSAVAVKNITEKITGISSQTNLLSLNASIESARAGEAGRGFAVVADEIRGLADETKALTNEISTIVAELELNAESAKELIQGVVDAVEKEDVLIDASKSSYEQLIEKFNDLYESIAMTQKELSRVVDSNDAIVDSISGLSASSEEVAASMEMAVELNNNNLKKTKDTVEVINSILTAVTELDKYGAK